MHFICLSSVIIDSNRLQTSPAQWWCSEIEICQPNAINNQQFVKNKKFTLMNWWHGSSFTLFRHGNCCKIISFLFFFWNKITKLITWLTNSKTSFWNGNKKSINTCERFIIIIIIICDTKHHNRPFYVWMR